MNDVGPEISDQFLNDLEAFLVQVPVTSPTVNSLATDTNVSSDSNGNATVVSLTAQSLNVQPAAVQLVGATAGTATLYQIDSGLRKYILVVLSNFWNASGGVQSIALPVPFVGMVEMRTQACYQVELWVASAAQTLNVVTALGAGGGTVANQTYLGPWSRGGCLAAVDTLSFRSGDTAGRSGLILLEGS